MEQSRITSALIVHELFSLALMDIRAEALAAKMSAIYHLSDLFHNLPAQLGPQGRGDVDYDEVLLKMKQKAEFGGYAEWIEQRIQFVHKKYSSDP